MKSVSTHVAVMLLLFSTFFSNPVSAQWTYHGNSGFSAAAPSQWQKIRIHYNNTPYVSCNDNALGGTVMKYNGTSWESIGSQGFTPGTAFHNSFAFGGGDTLYFAYADGNNMSRAAVMMYDGTNWISLGTGISPGECRNTNIEVSANGTPYLVYSEHPTGAVVAKMYDGTNWVNMGSGVINDADSDFPYTAFDHNGVLHVAYQDGDNDGFVSLVKWDGVNWLPVGTPYIATQDGYVARGISLVFDSNNSAYIAYYSGFTAGGGVGSAIKYDGTNWSSLGAGFAGPLTYFMSIAIAPDDTPYISYSEDLNNNSIFVLKYNGTSWDIIGNIISNFSYFRPSIAIDGNSNIFIAFQDGSPAGQDKTSVMSQLVCDGPTDLSILATDINICVGDAATLTVSGNMNDATDWYWYSGNCGGTPVGTGNTITVTPNDTTTYFASALGGCVISGGCEPLTVYVNNAFTPVLTVNNSVVTSSIPNGNQWYTNGAAINGETGQSYMATVDGWYYTVVTINGCSSTADSVFVTTTSSASVSRNSQVKIFPMPFTNSFKVTLNDVHHNDYSLSITDNTGRKIYDQYRLQAENSIDLSPFSSGIYFLELSSPLGKQTHKLIKQ